MNVAAPLTRTVERHTAASEYSTEPDIQVTCSSLKGFVVDMFAIRKEMLFLSTHVGNIFYGL